MCEVISEFSTATDEVMFKSNIARSEIEVISIRGRDCTTKKMPELTTRELKDALYGLKYMQPNKKVKIRNTVIDFAGEESHIWECIKHIQRILDHRSKYNME